MTRHKSARAPQQASFLEALLPGVESDTMPVQPVTASPKEEATLSPSESPAPEHGTRDLIEFILGLEPQATKDFWTHASPVTGDVAQTSTVLMTVDALQSMPNTLAIARASTDEIACGSNAVALAYSRLLEHFLELVTRIADVWNMLREHEGLESLDADAAKKRVATLLSESIGSARTTEDVENALISLLQDLSKLAQRLYGSVRKENDETIRTLADRLMQHALHERVDEEWMRAALEHGVRKMLIGQSQRIYSAIVMSALQRPFRKAVRELLEENVLPLPGHVLAHARQNGYRNVMREDLQSLARAGLTLQSASVGWLKAQAQEEQEQEVLWKARYGNCAVVVIRGYSVLNERVIELSDSALIIVFKCCRAKEHYSVPRADWERAKRLLWTKGFRAENEEGYPIPENVAQLWEDYFSDREYGWWYGDEAGRVIVVIRYSAARKIRNHERLRRVVAKMRASGYDLRYTDDALYFLPRGVDLPPRVETDDRDAEQENEEEA